MTDASRTVLRQLFIGGYNDLKARLARQLGSVDLASDALQDTWLQLETVTPSGPVRHPHSYLYRIAYYVALKHRRADRRTNSLEERQDALDVPAEDPDAETIADGRSKLRLLKEAARGLTERQRDILFASRLDRIPIKELAVKYGVTQRTIERELRHAVLHCARALGKNIVGEDVSSSGSHGS